jgi:hypothetical protein
MNTRSLTSSVVIFVSLMIAGLGMSAFGLRLPARQAGPVRPSFSPARRSLPPRWRTSCSAWAPSSACHRAPSSSSRWPLQHSPGRDLAGDR